MRSTPRSLLFCTLALLAAAACRDGDGSMARLPARPAAEESPYGATAAENLRVVPVEAEIPGLPAGLDGMRVAVLGDFQLGLWADNERVAAAAVRRAVELRPDLVVLLGDYVYRGDQVAALGRVLAPLRGRLVMAVLGDHDKRDEAESQGEPDSTAIRVVAALKQAGVVVLQNERGRIVRGGDTAFVAGVDPYVARRPEWRQAEIFGGIPRSGSTPLLLSHMPAGVLAAPDSAYPLVLSAHTFCGRVEVPGTPRLSWVNTEVLPAGRIPGADRLYRVNGNGLFITCGLGHSFVPVRVGSPPEVALLTLRRPAAAEAAPVNADTAAAALDSLVQVYQRRDTTRPDSTRAGAGADTTRPPGT